MGIGCIVLAAGYNLRFSKNKSKLFFEIDNTPIIDFTLNNLLSVINKKNLYITINKKITLKEKKKLEKYTENPLILGGATRNKSLINSLNQIDTTKLKYLFIHDAARPNTSIRLLKKIKKLISSDRYDSVIPYLNLEDTLKKQTINSKYKTLDRNKYIVTQTPQVFKTNILKNNINKNLKIITDDVQLIENKSNTTIKYILGEKKNLKITTLNDVSLFKSYLNKKIRIGNGFDLHKIKKGKILKLGNLKISSNYESVGHSDGDVVLHSLIDAMLGAIQKGDIGDHFPSTKKKYKNINSIELIDQIISRYNFKTRNIINVDITIICEHIRLSAYKNDIRKSISEILNCNIRKINVKAKTTDKVGIIGKSKAIACWINLLIHS